MAASPRWPEAFPQHGPGRKHDRPIVLEPWQREIVDSFPRELLRGLLDSDIRALFCEYCDRLAIRWTQSNPRNISVSHGRSVARLDAFMPAKS